MQMRIKQLKIAVKWSKLSFLEMIAFQEGSGLHKQGVERDKNNNIAGLVIMSHS